MSLPGDWERDRDTLGRPRNARPRDELGRPLPHDAVGVAGVPDDLHLSPAESLAQAQLMLDGGRAFHAHEVLEGAWKSAPDAERELWQGLAQFAVGLTHAQRGNATGAVQLLTRAADRVAGYPAQAPHGIAASALVDWARALATRIEQDGLASVTLADLSPRLTAKPSTSH